MYYLLITHTHKYTQHTYNGNGVLVGTRVYLVCHLQSVWMRQHGSSIVWNIPTTLPTDALVSLHWLRVLEHI